MKKLLLICTIAMSGLVTSCGDDDKQDDPQPSAIAPDAAVTGQWNGIHGTRWIYDSNGNQIGTAKEETISRGAWLISLPEPGGYEEKINGKTTTGTHSRNNATLTLNIPQPLAMHSGKYYIDSLTTNRMVLRDTVVANGLKTVAVLKLVR